MLNSELVRQARQTDLAQYLVSVGVPLIKSGSRHRHKEHQSLIFTKNAYYWNSRQEHGNAVDYLQKHMNMEFLEAVEALTGFTPSVEADQLASELLELEISPNCKRVIAYLNKARGISYAVIEHLIKTKHLFQEKSTNNAIFPMYDENNNYVGAESEGTLSNIRFKGIKSGSKYGYGFNVRYTDSGSFDYALFFESAVDLISFIDLKKNHENKSLNRCLLVSMSGLKINVLEHVLNVFKSDLKAFLCVDNDEAGQAFLKTVKERNINFKVYMPNEKYKDWNDQLNNKTSSP